MALSTQDVAKGKEVEDWKTSTEKEYQMKTLRRNLQNAKVGRPRAFETVEEMHVLLDEFFAIAKRPTVIALINALGMSKSMFSRYRNEETFKEFRNTIEKAVQLCEQNNIDGGLSGRLNGSFTQFYAKNAYGYVDRVEMDVDAKVSHSIAIDIPQVNQTKEQKKNEYIEGDILSVESSNN